MKSVTDHIRARLEKDLPQQLPSLDELRGTEFSNEFVKLMRNRLLVGAFRYQPLAEKAFIDYDLLQFLRDKIDYYKETGNLEAMVDIANIAMIEFEWPHHHKAHWNPTDDGAHCKKR